jgi:hypothetical protein
MTSLILMLLAFGIIHGAVVQVQPPPRDSIFTEYGKPPVDLQSMVADTDVVVRVQITRGAREEVYRPHPETEYPVTYFDVRILEVFKADTSLEAGDIMSIRRIGGLNDIESGFSKVQPRHAVRVLSAARPSARNIHSTVGPERCLRITG